MRIIILLILGLNFTAISQTDSLQQEFNQFIAKMECSEASPFMNFNCNRYKLAWISGFRYNESFLNKGGNVISPSACDMNIHFSEKERKRKERRIKKHGAHGMSFYTREYLGNYLIIKESVATGSLNDVNYYYEPIRKEFNNCINNELLLKDYLETKEWSDCEGLALKKEMKEIKNTWNKLEKDSVILRDSSDYKIVFYESSWSSSGPLPNSKNASCNYITKGKEKLLKIKEIEKDIGNAYTIRYPENAKYFSINNGQYLIYHYADEYIGNTSWHSSVSIYFERVK